MEENTRPPEEKTSTLDERIAELRARLNRMEMLSELEKTDIKELARKLYCDTFTQGLKKAITDAITEYDREPMYKLEAANSILTSLGLEPLPACGVPPEEIFNVYISRF